MTSRWALLVVLCACDPPRPVPIDAAIPDAPTLCLRGSLDLAVTTLAGCEQSGTEDGDRATARFNNPTNVEIAPSGTAFVADFDNGLIRKVEPDGTTTTLPRPHDFARPFGLAIAADGSLFVETDDNDASEHTETTGTIWNIDPDTGDAGVVSRNLGRPRGLAMLPDGKVALADHIHHLVSILDPATGIVTPLAGTLDTPGHLNATGTAALFAQPYDLVVDASGDLIVSDFDNHMLRKITLAGVVTDYAGSGDAGSLDGPNATARFDAPQGIAIAPDGTLFVTDVKRHVVRRIQAGMVTTVAGDGTSGWLYSDDPRGARFYGLEGIAADATRVIVSDGNIGDGMPFNRIRLLTRAKL